MTAVGAFAAFIALVGVYGAKAYAVSRRAREIGVRLAVGATPDEPLRSIPLRCCAANRLDLSPFVLLSSSTRRAVPRLAVSLIPAPESLEAP